MFIYYYRIFDRYRKPIASLAILIDGDNQWRPYAFKQNIWDTSIEMSFSMIKISDFLDKKTGLEASKNRFAPVLLAQLAVLEIKPLDAKLISKISLMKCLHTKGWNRDNILTLLEFIDWIIKLPEPLEEQCRKEIEIFEEEMKVAYITSWERYGIKKGEANLLLRLLLRKFKIVPDAYCQKIEQADADTLLIWGDRVLDSDSLDEIFKA